eukprot:GFYU01007239.1.p1 GENE.GFYU01007239.1~~GFYU01007239.1.p1  ORF type:complete len:313 (-),score=53.56 GFYU01007239.1:65-916(-)
MIRLRHWLICVTVVLLCVAWVAEARTLYHILQVDPTATDEEVKSAYRRLAKQWHPDKNSRPDAAEKFRMLTDAYKLLSVPHKRRQYDAELRYRGMWNNSQHFKTHRDRSSGNSREQQQKQQQQQQHQQQRRRTTHAHDNREQQKQRQQQRQQKQHEQQQQQQQHQQQPQQQQQQQYQHYQQYEKQEQQQQHQKRRRTKINFETSTFGINFDTLMHVARLMTGAWFHAGDMFVNFGDFWSFLSYGLSAPGSIRDVGIWYVRFIQRLGNGVVSMFKGGAPSQDEL